MQCVSISGAGIAGCCCPSPCPFTYPDQNVLAMGKFFFGSLFRRAKL